MEQTYIMIKPDGVQRGLVGQIIARCVGIGERGEREERGVAIEAPRSLILLTRSHHRPPPALLSSFEAKGYTLRALKMMSVPKELAEEHYADLSSKPFFGGLVEYICR